MTDNVIPLRFNVQQVGKHVKGSKKRFTWQVSLNSKQHIIVLDFSFISGKVKVAVDRKVLLQNQLPTNTSFQYPFTLDGNALNVIQQGQNFQLRINNKVFSHLYNQMKTNKQFKKYQDQVRDFKVNQNQFQAKKVTLNIGGATTGMKKKPKAQSSFQEHNWNAFGQNQVGSGFPSFFDNQSNVSTAISSKVQQKKQQKKIDNLLDISQNQKPSKQVSQNILDFQSQIQKPTIYNNTSATKQIQNDFNFNTMQNMFSTMNMGNNNQNKPSVVIDSNQVDFFSTPQDTSNIQNINNSKQNNNSSDLFSLMQTTTNNKPSNVNNSNNLTNLNSNQNNMQFMFNTISSPNQNNFGFGTGLNINQATNFSTMTSNMSQQSNNKPFNLQGFSLNNSNINQNTSNISLTSPVQPQAQITTGFQTNSLNAMQGLFSTNIMPQNTNSFQLNQNNFSTGIQIKSNKSQINQINLDLNSTPVQQNQIPINMDMNNININDYSTMQNLFQTNNLGIMSTQPSVNQQIKLQTVNNGNNLNNFGLNMSTNNNNIMASNLNNLKQSNNNTGNNSFESNFKTGIVSPNMMGINNYSGLDFNNSQNQGFNMNMNQFSTSVNNNKNINLKPLQKPITKPNQDLI